MATKHDEQIKKLQKVVDDKTKALGPRPKFILYTNGLYKGSSNSANLNTIDQDKAVAILTELLAKSHFHTEACKTLKVDSEYMHDGFPISDWEKDLKNRVGVLQWAEKNKQLDVTRKKLADLMSEDAKTDAALADIESLLN